ncbi:hypothetical protein SDC9_186953 [bioreactor metagenome]|uniref:Uncharacterized protein n=1 Tax=bioreactor metagenome TaxID=1076179 RepID=A0A645HK85_9ZZZZ
MSEKLYAAQMPANTAKRDAACSTNPFINPEMIAGIKSAIMQ